MRTLSVLFAAVLFASASGCDAIGGGDASADRLFPAVRDGKPLLLDREGQVVVSLSGYERAERSADGLAPARRWDGGAFWDLYRTDGEVAFTVRADEARAPSQDRVRVRVDGRWGYLDTEGRFVVNPYLFDARDFSDNVAAVRMQNYRWGLIGRDGQTVAEPTWDDLQPVRDGRARAKKGDRYGFVDAAGQEVIGVEYEDARSFSDGRAAVRQGQRWFFIDRDGKRPLGSLTFISAGDYGDGLAPVRTGNQWEYVDEGGEQRIQAQFEDARGFVDSRAAVKTGGLWTFIDTDGRQILPPTYDDVDDFDGGLARVRLDGRTGYVGRDGEIIWPLRN